MKGLLAGVTASNDLLLFVDLFLERFKGVVAAMELASSEDEYSIEEIDDEDAAVGETSSGVDVLDVLDSTVWIAKIYQPTSDTAIYANATTETIYNVNPDRFIQVHALARSGRAFLRKAKDLNFYNIVVEECAVMHAMILAAVKRLCQRNLWSALTDIPIFPEAGQFLTEKVYPLAATAGISIRALSHAYLKETITEIGHVVAIDGGDTMIQKFTEGKFAQTLQRPEFLDDPEGDDDDGAPVIWFARDYIDVPPFHVNSNRTFVRFYNELMNSDSINASFEYQDYVKVSQNQPSSAGLRMKMMLLDLAITQVFTLSYIYGVYRDTRDLFTSETPPDPRDYPEFIETVLRTNRNWPSYVQLQGLYRIFTNEETDYEREFYFYENAFFQRTFNYYNIRVGTNSGGRARMLKFPEHELLEVVDDPRLLTEPSNILGSGVSSTIYETDPEWGYALRISVWSEQLENEYKALQLLGEAGLQNYLPEIYQIGYLVEAEQSTDSTKKVQCAFAVVQLLENTLEKLFKAAPETDPHLAFTANDVLGIWEMLERFSNAGFMHHDMKPDNIMRVMAHDYTRSPDLLPQWYLIDLGGLYWTGPDPAEPVYAYGYNYVTEKVDPPGYRHHGWPRIILTGYVPGWDFFCLASYIQRFVMPRIIGRSVKKVAEFYNLLGALVDYTPHIVTTGRITFEAATADRPAMYAYQLPPKIAAKYTSEHRSLIVTLDPEVAKTRSIEHVQPRPKPRPPPVPLKPASPVV